MKTAVLVLVVGVAALCCCAGRDGALAGAWLLLVAGLGAGVASWFG